MGCSPIQGSSSLFENGCLGICVVLCCFQISESCRVPVYSMRIGLVIITPVWLAHSKTRSDYRRSKQCLTGKIISRGFLDHSVPFCYGLVRQ